MPFIKPQEKQSITERSSSDRKSCLVGWKANSSCNKHKMTKLAKGQASKMARRLPEQKSFNTPQRPAQKLLRGGLLGTWAGQLSVQEEATFNCFYC